MYMAIEAEMTNHQSGGSTKMTKSDIDLDRVIEEDRVGIKGLRR